MIVLLQKYPKISTLLVSVTSSLLYPLLIVTGYTPIHDSAFLLSIMDYYAISIHSFQQIPMWVPNIEFGIPFTFFETSTIGGLEIISLIFSVFFNIETSLKLFAFYVFVSSLITSLAINGICKILKVNITTTNLMIFMLFSISSPMYQIGFNFKLINSFIITSYFLLIVLKDLNFQNMIMYLISFVVFIIYGLPPYFIPIIIYIHLFALLVQLIKTQSVEKFRYILSSPPPKRSFVWIISILTLLILCKLIDLIYLRVSTCQKAPGRIGCLGQLTFESFLEPNLRKLEILKEMFGFTPNVGDTDFLIGPLLLTYGILFIIFRSNKLFSFKLLDPIIYFGLFSILFIFLFTNPFLIFMQKIIFNLPALQYVRHLNYFFILAKPIILLMCLYILIKYFERRLLWITILLFIPFIILTQNTIFYFILILLFLLSLDLFKNKILIILFFCLTSLYLQVQSMNAMNFDDTGIFSRDSFNDRTFSVRVDPLKSKFVQRALDLGVNLRNPSGENIDTYSFSTGAVYGSLNLTNLEDFYWQPFRQDIESKKFSNNRSLDFNIDLGPPSRVIMEYQHEDGTINYGILPVSRIKLSPNRIIFDLANLNFQNTKSVNLYYFGTHSEIYRIANNDNFGNPMSYMKFNKVFSKISNINQPQVVTLEVHKLFVLASLFKSILLIMGSLFVIFHILKIQRFLS
jgi:hypothetical protein